jgi:hypothetical protein
MMRIMRQCTRRSEEVRTKVKDEMEFVERQPLASVAHEVIMETSTTTLPSTIPSSELGLQSRGESAYLMDVLAGGLGTNRRKIVETGHENRIAITRTSARNCVRTPGIGRHSVGQQWVGSVDELVVRKICASNAACGEFERRQGRLACVVELPRKGAVSGTERRVSSESDLGVDRS